MNLLTEKWIPVLTKKENNLISPDEICDSEIFYLNAPRPDFQGALAQFLIGLLQTIYFKLNQEEWDKLYKYPPTKNELKSLFKILDNSAFYLDGYNVRFMQDMEINKKNKKPIASLLIEQPGEKTLKDNTDYFISRNSVNKICYSCAATALFTLQINAPSGGVGHRTSVRGGGPMTTLLINDPSENKTLWHMLWLNVIIKEKFEEYTKSKLEFPDDQNLIFPWLNTEKISDSSRLKDSHILQTYWCMPRRIKLDFEDTIDGDCDICGMYNKNLLQYYLTKNYGINYEGEWLHPLSPYRQEKKEDILLPLHPQPDGINYKYFKNIFIKNSAAVVANQINNNLKESIKIWSFGYDMDNMKSRCWYETMMPFYQINEGIFNIFSKCISEFIDVSEYAIRFLCFYLKKINSHVESAQKTFWESTEDDFYDLVNKILLNLEDNINYDLMHIKNKWLDLIRSKTTIIFDQYADSNNYENTRKVHKFFSAKRKLNEILFGKKMYNMLHNKG